MTDTATQPLRYHDLTIIQKINVKANVRAMIQRHTGEHNDCVYIAGNDLLTWQYDSPFYFSGSNPLY